MAAKLIIVEGLPGSGKSTTAEVLYKLLRGKGIKAELYTEGNIDHPADFEGVAYFTKEEFIQLKKIYFKSDKLLEETKLEYEKGYIIPYKKLEREKQIIFEEDLYEEILKRDIYEMPLKTYKNLIISRWKEFVANYIDKNIVLIFECCFIQNPVTVSMLRDNTSNEFTKSYIMELAEIILPLEPLLLYVEQENLKKSFNNAINARPKEWFQGFTDYYTKQGYGLANNLSGPEGLIDILEARRKLESEIFDLLALKKYKIDNSKFDIELLKERVNNIVENHFQV